MPNIHDKLRLQGHNILSTKTTPERKKHTIQKETLLKMLKATSPKTGSTLKVSKEEMLEMISVKTPHQSDLGTIKIVGKPIEPTQKPTVKSQNRETFLNAMEKPLNIPGNLNGVTDISVHQGTNIIVFKFMNRFHHIPIEGITDVDQELSETNLIASMYDLIETTTTNYTKTVITTPAELLGDTPPTELEDKDLENLTIHLDNSIPKTDIDKFKKFMFDLILTRKKQFAIPSNFNFSEKLTQMQEHFKKINPKESYSIMQTVMKLVNTPLHETLLLEEYLLTAQMQLQKTAQDNGMGPQDVNFLNIDDLDILKPNEIEPKIEPTLKESVKNIKDRIELLNQENSLYFIYRELEDQIRILPDSTIKDDLFKDLAQKYYSKQFAFDRAIKLTVEIKDSKKRETALKMFKLDDRYLKNAFGLNEKDLKKRVIDIAETHFGGKRHLRNFHNTRYSLDYKKKRELKVLCQQKREIYKKMVSSHIEATNTLSELSKIKSINQGRPSINPVKVLNLLTTYAKAIDKLSDFEKEVKTNQDDFDKFSETVDGNIRQVLNTKMHNPIEGKKPIQGEIDECMNQLRYTFKLDEASLKVLEGAIKKFTPQQKLNFLKKEIELINEHIDFNAKNEARFKKQNVVHYRPSELKSIKKTSYIKNWERKRYATNKINDVKRDWISKTTL